MLTTRYGICSAPQPKAYAQLSYDCERLPVLSVRTIASGGEALGSSLLGWARKILNVEVNEIYGQRECNLVICTDRSVNKTVPDGVMGKAVPVINYAL